MNKIRMSSNNGKELRSDWTRTLIPFKVEMVLRGLNILITLIADTLEDERKTESQPIHTTKKSRMFHGSLR